jgi:hypothetical protein
MGWVTVFDYPVDLPRPLAVDVTAGGGGWMSLQRPTGWLYPVSGDRLVGLEMR